MKSFLIFTVVDTEEITGFLPDVLSYNDYYPYGMLLPKRHASDESYRYGFNGMEKDDEVSVISLPDRVPHPRTVVIETRHALVAHRAVLRAERLDEFARHAELVPVSGPKLGVI